ncbi:MAG: Uma2 family endonuclease [Vicinamibacterales bacterium]|nr:Uma2 family endonuclease [Vicinamibacterales bacterium]
MAPEKAMQLRTSYADLERMPDDGRRYELYDGEIVVVPTPLPRHQDVVFRIAKALDAYAERCGGRMFIAPLDIVLSDYNVLQPDVLFFRASRVHLIDLDRVTRHAPDIAVEVLSPSTRKRDHGRKMEIYEQYGVREYWLVNPIDRSVERYELVRDHYEGRRDVRRGDTLTSPLLPELEIPLASLFA